MLVLLALLAAAAERTTPPAVVPGSPLAHTDVPAVEVAGGLTVRAVQVPGVRRVSAVLVLHGDPRAAAGSDTLRDVWAGAWGVATTTRDDAEVEDLASRLDLDFGVATGPTTLTLDLSVPADRLDAALDLWRDLLVNPRFVPADVRRMTREDALDLESYAPYDAERVASAVVDAAWWPASDPRRRAIDVRALRGARPGVLPDVHAAMLALGPAELVIVGDADPAELTARFAATLGGVGRAAPRAPDPARPPGQGTVVIGVDRPEQDQAWLRVVTPAPSLHDPHERAFSAVAHAVGGHFLSRLNRLLREEKGWTYGSRGRWSPTATDGTWHFAVDVAEANLGPALEATLAELDRVVAHGLDADEIATWRTNQVASWNTVFSTADTASGVYADLLTDGFTFATAHERLTRADAVTPDATRDAAGWLGRDDRLVVVVGDRRVIEGPVEALVGPVRWVDAQDAVVGRLEAE